MTYLIGAVADEAGREGRKAHGCVGLGPGGTIQAVSMYALRHWTAIIVATIPDRMGWLTSLEVLER
jgi:hypothetical protein